MSFSSTAKAKIFLFGSAVGSTYDAVLDDIGETVDALITRETGIPTDDAGVVTIVDEIGDVPPIGYGTTYELHLKRHPIAEITKLESRNSSGDWTEYTDETIADIEIDDWKVFPRHLFANCGFRQLRANYTAGYATANVPKDLQGAATMMIAAIFNARQGLGKKIDIMFDVHMALDDSEYRYIDRILKNYKIISII